MFKIFVVEDDEKIKDIVLENVSKWGYEGKGVESFPNILNEFVEFNPHIVLMDINLPAFDGFYWCNKIREISKVPIIFISSRNTNMDIIMAMNMGGDDFVQKPFSLEVLMAKVQAILRRTYSYTNVESNVLEHKGAILNLKDGNVMFEEEKVELTKNEFKILYMLMKNNGKVVSREKIMRSLWEDESFVDDNTLTVNINRLRKKLSDIGLEEYILTKKGQGYIV
ncbi:DNA-binding response regulator, OmpR family, contains REC and winged-helix (wHTH) domain [Clostridium cavendishii DSM 21758]|uniref:Stage 0 sporulation protein A homolog n=1 Tax=Clostridium cavendishii DSM 21758 TaxID=1121302 RepID=A0A1M6TGY3_9CLOT|nr:response regulator transcription factor [Clostridium cavendishii]SHK56302.1 DNA-binding response regulator, OmpR family, contains REC and winged-helix (wHTH) domain [Clostridium cavendishii DSM 21758]